MFLKRNYNLTLTLALLLVFPFLSFAQQIEDEISTLENELLIPEVELNVSASGRIGQTATISSYTININNDASDFFWYLDDVLDQRQSGKTKTDFSFTTTRENHIVRLVIFEGENKITENATLVSSYNVSLVWSADTYVPPEYTGKALPTRESKVTVVALPDIRGHEAENLLYTWYVDAESIVRRVAGQQEFSFFVTKNMDSIPIFVEVTNLSRSITVSQSVTIPVVRPSILISHSPSDEISKTSTQNLSISTGESAKLVAKPFNFQIKNLSELSYAWEFLGNTIKDIARDPHLLTLNIPENSAYGARDLKLSVENRNFFKERASTDLPINITR